MPAMEFAAVDQAYQKVRDAYAARAAAMEESKSAEQSLIMAKDRVEDAEQSFTPLQEAYLAAVAELAAVIQSLTEI